MNDRAMRPLSLPLLLGTALALAACEPDPGPLPLEGARMRNAFTLTSHDNRRVSSSEFAGKYRIVYFGYTHCPDICPVDLARIGAALRQFEQSDPERAEKVQPIFITTDPERDTPDVLRQFVDDFHPRLIGLTGSADEVGRVAAAHGAAALRGPSSPGSDAYLVDHNRLAVLYDPEGKPIVMLPTDRGIPEVLAELDRWVR